MLFLVPKKYPKTRFRHVKKQINNLPPSGAARKGYEKIFNKSLHSHFPCF